MAESNSSRSLDAILEEGGTVAETIRSRVHRTMLWKYRTGKRKPDADGIALLHELSNGRIAGEGWADLPQPKRREARGRHA